MDRRVTHCNLILTTALSVFLFLLYFCFTILDHHSVKHRTKTQNQNDSRRRQFQKHSPLLQTGGGTQVISRVGKGFPQNQSQGLKRTRHIIIYKEKLTLTIAGMLRVKTNWRRWRGTQRLYTQRKVSHIRAGRYPQWQDTQESRKWRI